MSPIIDVHAHIGAVTSDRMSANGAELARMQEAAGITHTVAFSIESCYGSVDLGNRYTVSEAERQPSLSVMVVAHPLHMKASAAWIREAKSNPKIVGVKLHPALGDFDVLDKRMFELMEEHIGPSGLTVLSHTGNDSANVTIDKYLKLASHFPKTRFIAAHLGVGVLGSNHTAVNAWHHQAPDNVWFDMGTLRAFVSGAVENLLDVVGPDRICFGTDAPLYRPAPFVTVLETLPVSKEVKEKIAWRNALAANPALAPKLEAVAR